MANLSGEITLSTSNAIHASVQSNGILSNAQGIPFNTNSKLIAGLYFIERQYVNSLSSLARFFGINATQDAAKLYINKADLPGLTPSVNNTAESLLTAIFLRVIAINDYESRLVIEKQDTEFIESRQQKYIRNSLLIFGYVPVTYVLNTGFEPLSSEIAPETLPGFSPQNY